MSAATVDWGRIGKLSGTVLQNEVFSLLQVVSSGIQTGELDDPAVLGAVPRLAELLENRKELAGFKTVFDTLARSVGLWNYIDRKTADSRDEIIAEFAYVRELGMVLHREQVNALDLLLEGHNLILSAPTSFGKSILVDALLLQERYRRVAIVLPTIALLDEFRRRLVRRFGQRYKILMHHSESAPAGSSVIFLGTQERLINRDDLGRLDLVVVDEFYKLDPARKDERSVALNAAVYRLLSRAKQFFFLGPNIENVQISPDSRWHFSFLRTRFSTVAVDTFDLKGVPDREQRLFEELEREDNWPALVFVSSPDKANKLAVEVTAHIPRVGRGKSLASWMTDNYGSKWDLSDAVAAGIGVHHGRIPRALASRFVALFNKKELPVLICTSTLIEGVNTAAKSVLIYDKTIARSNFDFFTFSNIRGRAGRLGQHHVGRVYLFHAPPGAEEVEVSAPLFGDPDEAPDEYVVHLSPDDATPTVTERVEEMAGRTGLTPAELRRFSSLGVETLEEFREATEQAVLNRGDLIWLGSPSYNQILEICSVICSVRSPNEFGCFSDRQLALYIHNLRSHSTMRGFYRWHSDGYNGQPALIDNIFKFLRAAEYSLPEYVSLIEIFVKKLGHGVDYSLLSAELCRWFRPEELKILEEQGVPIQISERFYRRGDSLQSLSVRLRDVAVTKDQRLSALEREWILDALPSA